jgi:thiamine-phosphate pyrophosphorylase
MSNRSRRFAELPRLYPILDAGALARAGLLLADAAQALYDAGLRWVQYRDKQGSDAEVVERMHVLRAIYPVGETVLLLNDRVHLCAETGADGVHVGQEDMPPMEARRVLGADKLLGVSTHNVGQMRAAAATGVADYLAIGPVYATGSKENPDPVVGLEEIRAARALTDLPLVAIGGISRETGRAVLEAGADAVAVISALLPGAGQSMAERVRDFLGLLR